MKNQVLYLCLAMLLMSTIVSAQERERKTQFYVQYGFMSVGNQSREYIEDYDFYIPFFNNQPYVDVYQGSYRKELNFYNTRSLGFGILKRMELKPNLYLKYGAGVDLLGFSLWRDSRYKEYRLIDRVTLIEPGVSPVYSVERINEPFEIPGSTENRFYWIGFEEQISTISLNLPLEIQYSILDVLSVSGGLNIDIPLFVSHSMDASFQGNRTLIRRASSSLERTLAFASLGTQFNLSKKYSVQLKYNRLLNNLFKWGPSDDNYNLEHKKLKVNHIIVGLNYHF